ncbi:MAG: H+-translocating transhydrogenase subunit alpha [Gaiellaceae bacterium]|jgi:NAD(P) transhydrogenase subunit alpha|nr:H+-translocating transhydrogenase subunit alpha [Gaiellaceae bacterium]
MTTTTTMDTAIEQLRAYLASHPGGIVFTATAHSHSVTSQTPSLIVFEVTILVLAIFLGIEVISKVPTMLHTPLMSGTNAIHGIVIVGAILVAGSDHPGWLMKVVGFVAVVLATANVVGGFVVTDRMLEMFKPKAQQKKPDDEA